MFVAQEVLPGGPQFWEIETAQPCGVLVPPCQSPAIGAWQVDSQFTGGEFPEGHSVALLGKHHFLAGQGKAGCLLLLLCISLEVCRSSWRFRPGSTAMVGLPLALSSRLLRGISGGHFPGRNLLFAWALGQGDSH